MEIIPFQDGNLHCSEPEWGLVRRLGLALAIDRQNWPAPPTPAGLPGLPEVAASLLQRPGGIQIAFSCRADGLLLRHDADQAPVWEDSCVELFIAFGAESAYYNFEWNPRGACLAAYGPSRDEREFLPAASMRLIGRWSSAAGLTPGYHEGPTLWRFLACLPWELFGGPAGIGQGSLVCRANLQACADAAPRPYYLSWAPIHSPAPDFHRPECFRVLAGQAVAR